VEVYLQYSYGSLWAENLNKVYRWKYTLQA
jgi:hypothetical protein